MGNNKTRENTNELKSYTGDDVNGRFNPSSSTSASSNGFLRTSASSSFKVSNRELNSMIVSSKMDSEIYLYGYTSSLYYDGINPGCGVAKIIDNNNNSDSVSHSIRDLNMQAENVGLSAVKLILKHTLVAKVVSGRLHSHIITADGKVLSFGSNNHGQLGCGTVGSLKASHGLVRVTGEITNHFIIDGAAGGYHSLFITSEHKVFAVGGNSSRQLGVITTDSTATAIPIQIPEQSFDGRKVVACSAGDSHSCFLTSCGHIYFSGSNSNGSCVGISGNNRPTLLVDEILANEFPIQISCGYDNTMILCQSGNVYGVGCNSCGQLATEDGEHTNFGDIRRIYKGARGIVWIGSGYFCSAICAENECYFAPSQQTYSKLSEINSNAIAAGVGDSIIFATNEINESGKFGKLYVISSGKATDITGEFSMDSISSKIEFSGQRDVYIAYASKVDPAFLISHHFLHLEKIVDFVKGNLSQYSSSTVFSDVLIQIDQC